MNDVNNFRYVSILMTALLVKEHLKNYLSLALGLRVSVDRAPSGKNLPRFLRVPEWTITISDQKLILIWRPEGLESITPAQLLRHKELYEEGYSLPAAFCFEGLQSYERKRLISQKISFIIPGRQLYLPHLMMDFREYNYKVSPQKVAFTPSAQFLILYHLIKNKMDDFSLGEISGKFLPQYSLMTVSRAARELESRQLLVLEGRKQKKVRFLLQGRALFDSALPFLASPVVRVLYSDSRPDKKLCVVSGLHALSQKSNLTEPPGGTFAVSGEYYQKFLIALRENSTPFAGAFAHEVWSYDPTLLSNGGIADSLSLFLIYNHDGDERIRSEAKSLLRSFSW